MHHSPCFMISRHKISTVALFNLHFHLAAKETAPKTDILTEFRIFNRIKKFPKNPTGSVFNGRECGDFSDLAVFHFCFLLHVF